MGRMASLSFVVLCVLSLGCSSTTPLGTAGVCIATSEDEPPEEGTFQRTESRTGLVRVPADQELEEPRAFEECARGMNAWAQFVDEDGVHIWLAADARHGAKQMVPSYIFEAVGEGGRLEASVVEGWTPGGSLVVSDDDGVVLALSGGADLSEDGLETDGLTIALGGATALGTPASCGMVTERSVRFITDDGEQTLASGQLGGGLVHGTEFQFANIYTFERSGSQCTDGGANALGATWVAVDASL